MAKSNNPVADATSKDSQMNTSADAENKEQQSQVNPVEKKDESKETKANPKPAKAEKYSPDVVKRAKEVFAQHKVDVIYMTGDCTAFLEPQYARIHAGNIQNPEILTIKRQEIK